MGDAKGATATLSEEGWELGPAARCHASLSQADATNLMPRTRSWNPLDDAPHGEGNVHLHHPGEPHRLCRRLAPAAARRGLEEVAVQLGFGSPSGGNARGEQAGCGSPDLKSSDFRSPIRESDPICQ
jgi:hypothetical protein